MDVRGSSTALDTVLFVLLVGASIATLASVDPGDVSGPSRVADETADVLATSTTEVTATRTGSVLGEGPVVDGEGSVSVERRAHGTYAELLAAAAVANPSLGSRSVTGTGKDFERAVTNATGRTLPVDDANVEVRATWRPYRDAALADTIRTGERPPPDADVTVATITVASGFPNASSRIDPSATSFDRIAHVVAAGVVRGLFPPSQTRDALASEGPDRAIVATRYRRASAILDVETGSALADGDVETANRRLAVGLAGRLKQDLVGEFDSPAVAARSVAVDRVRIVVRTWSS